MAKKTVAFHESGIGKLPDDKPVVYRILTDGGRNNYTGVAKRGRVQERLHKVRLTMFSKRGIERLAGAFLVASFVAFLGHVVTLVTLGAGPTTILFVLIYCFLVMLSAMTL